MVNLNKMATRITLKEGKKKSISIGQVKEVMKLTFQELAKIECFEVLKIVRKYR